MIAFKDTIFAYALYYPAVEILSSIAIALIVWRGGFGVIGGVVTIGVLSAFIQYSQRFFRPIMDLSEKFNILQAAMAACERIFQAAGYADGDCFAGVGAKVGDGAIGLSSACLVYVPGFDGGAEGARWLRLQPDELAAMGSGERD
jgi:hypothetical protein